jgi:hypothetical protein
MFVIAGLVMFQAQQGGLAQDALSALQRAVGSGNRPLVESMFLHPPDSEYLFRMAERSGGMRSLRVKVFPSPPGWPSETGYWATIHTAHSIQQDRDAVYPLVFQGSRFVLGTEIPEHATSAYGRIKTSWADVRVKPGESSVDVGARLDVEKLAEGRALLFRLNDFYLTTAASIDGKTVGLTVATGDTIPRPGPGEVLRVGGLVIPWVPGPVRQLGLTYGGRLEGTRDDKVAAHVAYVTAWWLPSLARLPHRSFVRVVGPDDWVLRSEGPRVDAQAVGFEAPRPVETGEKAETFDSLIPISFPKVIGGRYRLAAELVSGGKTFRAFHLDPAEPDRAKRDVEIMAKAMPWYEENLGPWPYDGYEVYDADTYYGIESYSHTLLRRDVTTRFVTHEMVHTYFGGLVPSAYARDTWNEGVTQYVDSVLYDNNRDRSLQNGLRTANVRKPLTGMDVAWEHGNASYYRGAYVLKMLENEIGQRPMMEALRAMVAERRGQETLWPDLLTYFERTSGQRLGWFWSQWIEGADFPRLEIVDTERTPRDGRFATRLVVRQTGVPLPYRLRFTLVVTRGPDRYERVVEMRAPEEAFTLETEFPPTEATVDVFGRALATHGPAVRVRTITARPAGR